MLYFQQTLKMARNDRLIDTNEIVQRTFWLVFICTLILYIWFKKWTHVFKAGHWTQRSHSAGKNYNTFHFTGPWNKRTHRKSLYQFVFTKCNICIYIYISRESERETHNMGNHFQPFSQRILKPESDSIMLIKVVPELKLCQSNTVHLHWE